MDSRIEDISSWIDKTILKLLSNSMNRYNFNHFVLIDLNELFKAENIYNIVMEYYKPK
jgi:hypothetical protein